MKDLINALNNRKAYDYICRNYDNMSKSELADILKMFIFFSNDTEIPIEVAENLDNPIGIFVTDRESWTMEVPAISIEEGYKLIKEFETEDIADGTFTEDFYEMICKCGSITYRCEV